MKNSNGKGRVPNSINSKLRVPPLEPQKIFLWFTVLEMQFQLASITNDKFKFNALIANLGYQYLKLVVDVVFDPPATGRYDRLKSELIKQLADSNETKVWKLLEGQKIEDRTPSQFHRDLKRMANALLSDDVVLMFWKTRLPLSMQRVLDVVEETNESTLTEMADRIHEIWLETGEVTAINAQSRSRSERHRLRSRENLQQPALCYCQATLNNSAKKCHCPWNGKQNQGNAKQSSMVMTYEADVRWGLIYVKDTTLEIPFLVDTGAARCTFPRKYMRGYSNRVKDKDYYLIAANGTVINTYGPIQVYLSLGCKWRFEWQFIVADVISPVIGMDFLQYHGFLVDTRNKCLFKPPELGYEILCHGCHWGLDVPHTPNPAADAFAKTSDLTRPSAFERKRLSPEAERHSDPLALIKSGCVDINPPKRKDRIQGDDGPRATLPFNFNRYSRLECVKLHEICGT